MFVPFRCFVSDIWTCVSQGYWNVLLDGRRVKTPSKEILHVPSKILAMAIAAEFQYQGQDYVCFCVTLSETDTDLTPVLQ